MQDFRQLRFHPRALARGQDDDVDVVHERGFQPNNVIPSESPKWLVSGTNRELVINGWCQAPTVNLNGWCQAPIVNWLFSLFIAFDDLVDLLRGHAEPLADKSGDLSFRAPLARICYLTKQFHHVLV